MKSPPKKPTKKIEAYESATYDWIYCYEKSTALSDFLEWIEEVVPRGAKNVLLKVDESWMYDDCTVNLEVHWQRMIPNPQYAKDMKKYEAKMRKWEKQCQK